MSDAARQCLAPRPGGRYGPRKCRNLMQRQRIKVNDHEQEMWVCPDPLCAHREAVYGRAEEGIP